MKTLLILAAVAGSIAMSGCSRTADGAGIGAVGGAAVGAIATGTPEGALVGAAIGAGTGALIGAATEPGQCYYRDRYGRRYIDRC